jgi:hypothetical protein
MKWNTLFSCAVAVLALRTILEIVAGVRWALGIVRSRLVRSSITIGEINEIPCPAPSVRRRRTRNPRTNYLNSSTQTGKCLGT